MLNAEQDYRTSIHQTYFVSVPLFSQPILTKQNIAYTKNSQQFLASQVSVLRGNKATNSSTSNIPFSVALKAFVLVYYSTFLNLSSHLHGRVVFHLWIKMKKV